MNFLSTLQLVFRTLLARKGRSVLTILGIVIGVAGVITIIALGAGAQSLVLNQVTKLGSNLVGILPGKTDETGPPAAVFGIQITTLINDDAESLKDTKRFPHITSVAGFARGSGTVVWQNKDVDTYFSGTQASVTSVQNIEIEQGRFFDEQEERGGANVVVLGSTVKEQLFGDTNPIGQAVKITTKTTAGTASIPFVVIGTVIKQGTTAFQNLDDQVYIPLVVAQKQLLGINYLQYIRAKVDSSENVRQTIDQINTAFLERHKIKNLSDADFEVRDLADAIKLLTGITNALRLFLVAMAAISLVVGGIGIMNIMLVTVAERTREIGLRKAVGATNSAMRNQFLLEAGSLTLVGGIFGIILGVIISYLIALGARYAGYEWAFVISPISVLLAVGVSILTGVVFGLYPAFKAAKLNPIEALRYE
jgi:putative ABC transport system permease protein